MFEKIKTIIGLLFLGLILSAVVMMTEIVPTRVNGSDISLLTVIICIFLPLSIKYLFIPFFRNLFKRVIFNIFNLPDTMEFYQGWRIYKRCAPYIKDILGIIGRNDCNVVDISCKYSSHISSDGYRLQINTASLTSTYTGTLYERKEIDSDSQFNVLCTKVNKDGSKHDSETVSFSFRNLPNNGEDFIIDTIINSINKKYNNKFSCKKRDNYRVILVADDKNV